MFLGEDRYRYRNTLEVPDKYKVQPLGKIEKITYLFGDVIYFVPIDNTFPGIRHSTGIIRSTINY